MVIECRNCSCLKFLHKPSTQSNSLILRCKSFYTIHSVTLQMESDDSLGFIWTLTARGEPVTVFMMLFNQFDNVKTRIGWKFYSRFPRSNLIERMIIMPLNQRWLSRMLHRVRSAKQRIAKPAVSLFLIMALLLLLLSFPLANIGAQDSNVTPMIAGGDNHTVALKEDGTVWAWGDNRNGQLGEEITTACRTTPVQVHDLTGVTAIAAGVWHTVALKEDGTVWAWGHNGRRQLGDGYYQGLSQVPVSGKRFDGSNRHCCRG